jgi:ubiquinone/menaquinone biosynthesis C-methylase UbiE
MEVLRVVDENEDAKDKWGKEFQQEIRIGQYPKYPNEVMLKALFGGSNYFSVSEKPQSNWRVLDVGRGFANNLIPFSELGCECHGIDITLYIVNLTKKVVTERGIKAEVQVGSNRAIPYPDSYFDLLLSLSTLHYEGGELNVMAALHEYKRVLKPNGIAFIVTTGPVHDIQTKAKTLGQHQYIVQNFDFRDGEKMFFFDSENYLSYYCSKSFSTVETGRVTERLGKTQLDFLVALCKG